MRLPTMCDLCGHKPSHWQTKSGPLPPGHQLPSQTRRRCTRKRCPRRREVEYRP